MRFDKLHEKFLKVWKSSVCENEWQANAIHLVLLSQLMGTLPSNDALKPRDYYGMRVQINGGWAHPRLHYFLVQASGTGKGEGQKAMMNCLRYFNLRLFAQRYGVTDVDKDLWQAYERYRKAIQQARWESEKEENEEPATAEDPDDAMPEEEAKEEAKVPKTKDGKPRKQYTMTEVQKRDLARDIANHEGDFWRFFATNTANIYPMSIQASKTTLQRLVGGYETTPNKQGLMTRVWKPGKLQSQSVYAWDEARNILFAKDQEGASLNAALCTALDLQGNVTTGARKDLDEDGNDPAYLTYTSVITGTTEVSGLDQTLAEGGLLQRFMIGYHKFTPEEALALRRQVARNRTTPETLWGYLKDYYEEFASQPVWRGKVTFSDAAMEYQDMKIEEEEQHVRELFGTGSPQHRLAGAFLNRRSTLTMRAGAIMAALDNQAIVSKEHMKKVFDLIGMDTLDSIELLIDDCAETNKSGSEAKNATCNNILMETMMHERAKGNHVVSQDMLKELVRNHPGWKRRGDGVAKKAIENWADTQSSFVQKEIDRKTGSVSYRLRAQTTEYTASSKAKGKAEMEMLKREQGIQDDESWVNALGGAETVEAAPEDEESSAPAEISKADADALREYLEKKKKRDVEGFL